MYHEKRNIVIANRIHSTGVIPILSIVERGSEENFSVNTSVIPVSKLRIEAKNFDIKCRGNVNRTRQPRTISSKWETC